MKKVIICCFMLSIAVFIYFQTRSQISTESNSVGNVLPSVGDNSNPTSNLYQNSSDSGEESLLPDKGNHLIPEKTTSNKAESSHTIKTSDSVETSNSKQHETSMSKMATILPEALAAEGFPEAIGVCIVKASEENLKAEHPLSFDGLADKCSDIHNITGDSKLSVRKIFRNSISNTSPVVNIDEWYKCASAITLKGSTCLNEHYRFLVDNFYSENRGNSQLTRSELSKNWIRTVDNSVEKLIKQCPQTPDSLTEVYVYECNL